MNILNIEIKARCKDQDNIRKILQQNKAVLKGIDKQIDTYFKVSKGRLKLREGNIENNLIYYKRDNKKGPKQSNVILLNTNVNSNLKKILRSSLEILVVVEKTREIYFIDNIKFHIDTVKNLGKFIEIEAIDEDGSIAKKVLQEQCETYLRKFEIKKKDLVQNSYSDMLMEDFIIREGSPQEIVALSHLIPEFENPYPVEEYKKRLLKTKHLILIAEKDDRSVGFKVGYKRNDHFYSWMGGVLPDYRQLGIAASLAKRQEKWAFKNGFAKIMVKTLNKHKNMLQFLIKNKFDIKKTKSGKFGIEIILEKIL